MSSMLKLLAIVALLSSLTYAESTSEKLEDFLTSEFEDNPRLKSVEVKVGDIVPLKDLKGWNAYVVNVQAVLNEKPKDTIHQKMIWFSDGKIITKELTNMINGQNLAELVNGNVQIFDRKTTEKTVVGAQEVFAKVMELI